MAGRRIAIGLALLTATALSAALPGPAAARRSRDAATGTRFTQILLQGSHGYRIDLSAYESEYEPNPGLIVSATRGRDVATYTVSRGVRFGSDGSVSARIPGVGRVEVEFTPGRERTPKAFGGCKGGQPTTEASGWFAGTIHLRGRQGFTTVDRGRARGKIVHEYDNGCRHRGSRSARPKSKDDLEALALSATGKRGKVATGLLALKLRLGEEEPILDFEGFAYTADGGVSFLSATSRRAGSAALAVPDEKALDAATVAPPAPFSGSASYGLVGPKKASWTGDLAVELPGFGSVPLAGPGFTASLCLEKHCTGQPAPEGDGEHSFSVISLNGR